MDGGDADTAENKTQRTMAALHRFGVRCGGALQLLGAQLRRHNVLLRGRVRNIVVLRIKRLQFCASAAAAQHTKERGKGNKQGRTMAIHGQTHADRRKDDAQMNGNEVHNEKGGQ